MAYMTDAEAERLDEYYTKNTIMPVPGSLGPIAKLKQSLRPGEVLSFKCVIEDDEDELDNIFTGAAEIEERDLATAANA
jgi:hypothetical protein